MDQVYHIRCFTCCDCAVQLQGKPFYALEGKPYCKEDYLVSSSNVPIKKYIKKNCMSYGYFFHFRILWKNAPSAFNPFWIASYELRGALTIHNAFVVLSVENLLMAFPLQSMPLTKSIAFKISTSKCSEGSAFNFVSSHQ